MSARPKVLLMGPDLGSKQPVGLLNFLIRAAQHLQLPYAVHNSVLANPLSGGMQRVYQRLVRAEPMHLRAFSAGVVERVRREGFRYLLTCGDAPLTLEALLRMRDDGVSVLNYSTDDPWGPPLGRWRIPTLGGYAAIFTPRRANFEAFKATGCPRVELLPFGYDQAMHRPATDDELRGETRHADIVFIGGADRDRVPYLRALARTGLKLALYGAGWSGYRDLRRYDGGKLIGREMAAVLARTRLSMCLVRRANRDEHVMRTYEEPAIGAAVLMEDTRDHRALFTDPAARAGFFKTPEELAARARELCADGDRRRAMQESLRTAVIDGHNSYTDRVRTMLAAVDYPL